SLYRARHHRALRSFPTRRSSDLHCEAEGRAYAAIEKSWFGSVILDADADRAAKRLERTAAAWGTTPAEMAGRALAGTPEQVVERSEEHTSELQSRFDLVCRLLLE